MPRHIDVLASLALATGLAACLYGPALAQSGSPKSADDGREAGGFADFSLKGQDPSGNTAKIDEKGVAISSADDSLKFRIGGRLQYDFGTARVREFRFPKTFNDSDDFRRSWVEGYLTILNAIELAFQYDFADNTRPINDAVIAFTALDPLIFSVGNMKEPFSLNQLTSDNNTLFTERSLADAFAPARNVGFAIGGHGEAWTATAGVFGGNANTGVGENGIAGTARLTYAPLLSKDEVLHLGVAGSFRSLDRNGTSASFNVRPESFLFRTALVDTSSIKSSDSISRIGLEAAYQKNGFRLQGEYIVTSVDRFDALPTARFAGGYVEAGWTVNGNGRPYELSPKYGTTYAIFGAPKLDDSQRVTKGGPGVFELGVRVSFVDLTDRYAGAKNDVTGGRQVDYTFGVNWYPEPNIKLATDYVRAHAFNAPAAKRDVESDIFIGRLQLYW